MRCPLHAIVLIGFALAGCGKSTEERVADVETCSATATTAAAITRCLRDQSGWPWAAAESAGLARALELDGLETEIGAITARADSEHQGQVRVCDHVLVDLKTCLITRYGWEDDRASAADDSVWHSRAALHQQQIHACLGRHGAGTGACLQLHYKWLPRRALALDDSLRRANLQ